MARLLNFRVLPSIAISRILRGPVNADRDFAPDPVIFQVDKNA
jgi:hypothetical protein